MTSHDLNMRFLFRWVKNRRYVFKNFRSVFYDRKGAHWMLSFAVTPSEAIRSYRRGLDLVPNPVLTVKLTDLNTASQSERSKLSWKD